MAGEGVVQEPRERLAYDAALTRADMVAAGADRLHGFGEAPGKPQGC